MAARRLVLIVTGFLGMSSSVVFGCDRCGGGRYSFHHPRPAPQPVVERYRERAKVGEYTVEVYEVADVEVRRRVHYEKVRGQWQPVQPRPDSKAPPPPPSPKPTPAPEPVPMPTAEPRPMTDYQSYDPDALAFRSRCSICGFAHAVGRCVKRIVSGVAGTALDVTGTAVDIAGDIGGTAFHAGGRIVTGTAGSVRDLIYRTERRFTAYDYRYDCRN